MAIDLRSLFLSAISLALAACTTLSDDVSVKKMQPKQRLYVGRILVTMNEKPAPKCEVYLNMDVAPSIKLTPDGFLIYKTDRSELKFRSIACYDQLDMYLAAWHHQKLNLTAVSRPEDQNTVNYFGD